MMNQVSDHTVEGSADQTEIKKQVAAEGQETQSTESDVVKYDTYRKTLSEAKRAKAERDELLERLTKLEQEKLQAEGNKDQLIDSLRKEKDQLSSKLKTAVGSFARSRIHEALMSEMSKAGCQDPEIVIKAYGSEFDDVEFDDEFTPSRDQIKAMVEKIKGERSYLFGKQGPRLANHQLKPDGVGEKEVKPLSKLSTDELVDLWGKTLKS